MGPKLSPMRIFLHSKKLLSMNSYFPKCVISSKCIRRLVTVASCLCEVCENASLLVKEINSSLKSGDILLSTARNMLKTHTYDSSSKDCILGNCPECLKSELSLSDFKADADLISFLQRQRVEKKIVKVNLTMLFGQVIPKWVEKISNLKRHIYRKREQVASYNKQKDELKIGEAFINVDYSKSYNDTQTSLFLRHVYIP